MKVLKVIFVAFLSAVLLFACSKDEDSGDKKEETYQYYFKEQVLQGKKMVKISK